MSRIWQGQLGRSLQRRVVALSAALSAALLVLAGCAVPVGSEPRPVDSDITELLQPQTTPTPVETAPPRPVQVTWVRGEKLVRVPRLVPAESRDEQLDAALFELVVAPRAAEQRQGLITLLPPDLIIDGTLRGRRAVLDLTVTTQTEQGGVPLALGQIATTAMSVPGVRSVVFSVEGERFDVPIPGRSKDVRVVTMRDYRKVLAR